MAGLETTTAHATPPECLIVLPTSGSHRHSIIILHGRGSNAKAFSEPLLILETPDHGTLQTAFPDARLIFPTAPRSLVRRSKEATMTQWFDFWSLKDPELGPEIQVDGLRDTAEYVHYLVRQEAAAVGTENVIVWGMSQGAAASLVAMLLWEGKRVAAWVGMCGWLPLRRTLEETVQQEQGGETEATQSERRFKTSIARLREALQLPSASSDREALEIPAFIGHGEDDSTTSANLAKEAASLLKLVSVDVDCRVYPGLDHWYSEDMLSDIICFIKSRLSFERGSSTGGIERREA